MRRNQNQSPLLWLLPVPMVLWLAALLATEYKAGMTVFTLMGRFSWLMEHPALMLLTAPKASGIVLDKQIQALEQAAFVGECL